jgi:transcriptional regulator with XRE-family HTH domain
VFYDIFIRACEEKGVAPTRVLVDLGISKSAYSNWKDGGDASNKIKKLIADYFGVSVREFLAGQIKNPATENGSGLDGDDDMYKRIMRLPPDKRETVRVFLQGIEAGLKD